MPPFRNLCSSIPTGGLPEASAMRNSGVTPADPSKCCTAVWVLTLFTDETMLVVIERVEVDSRHLS